MNKAEWYLIIGLAVALGISILLSVFYTKPADEPDNGDDGKSIYWGVDSASYTDDSIYQCVKDNFGTPEIWGRYLGNIEGVSQGLDKDEIKYLHDHDVRILVIYNHFNDATGYDNGKDQAKKAIEYAKDLGMPEDVAIFADIEPKYPVDSAFIDGWYETIKSSNYNPGIYGVFSEDSKLVEAYIATKKETQEKTILWTAYPQKEITTKENAPEYKPQGPENGLLYGWQYAIDAKDCNIDTNLFKKDMLDYLW